MRPALYTFPTLVLLAVGSLRASAQALVVFDDGGSGRRGCYLYSLPWGRSTLMFDVPPEMRFDSLTGRPTERFIYGLDSAARLIYQIDVWRGRFEIHAQLGVAGLAGIAVDAADGLYAVSGADSRLYRLEGGRLRLIGDATPVTAGLTFFGGTLLGFDGSTHELYEIDPATAMTKLVGGSGDAMGRMTDAAEVMSGELFVAEYEGRVFRVDPASGRRTLIGPIGTGIGLLGVMDRGSWCNPCDTNCDGRLDAFDIDCMACGICLWDCCCFNGPCSPCAGDTNGDGQWNAFDIEPFIDCLFGP